MSSWNICWTLKWVFIPEVTTQSCVFSFPSGVQNLKERKIPAKRAALADDSIVDFSPHRMGRRKHSLRRSMSTDYIYRGGTTLEYCPICGEGDQQGKFFVARQLGLARTSQHRITSAGTNKPRGDSRGSRNRLAHAQKERGVYPRIVRNAFLGR